MVDGRFSKRTRYYNPRANRREDSGQIINPQKPNKMEIEYPLG